MNFINKAKNNTFLKIFSYVLMPILLMTIFMIINIIYLSVNYQSMVKKNYNSYLQTVYANCEATLQDISQTIPALETNSSFMSVVSGNGYSPEDLYATMSKISEAEKNSAYIDNIVIVDRFSQGVVITKNSTCDIKSYFSSAYHYQNYDHLYWSNYKYALEKTFLAPTDVYIGYSSIKRNILPLVFTKINDTSIQNIVIVNIDFEKLLTSLQSEEMSEKTTFGVINRYRKTLYTNSAYNTKLSNEFYNMLYSQSKPTFNCTINKEKSYVATYSSINSALGYTYTIIVPYSEIRSGIQPIILVYLLLMVIFIIALIVVGYASTKKIYTPIKSLASLISHEKGETDLIAQLHSSITELTELANNPSRFSATSTLPYTQEHLIINMLNSEEESSVPHLDEVRSEKLLDFEHDYFCSVIVNISLSDEFYDSYNAVDYNSIISGLYNIIQPCFSEKFSTYILPSKTNTLYLLLNIKGKEDENEINEIIDYIKRLLEYDSIYISVSFGTGGIHKDLTGLKKSHHKALRSVDLKDAHTLVNLEKASSDALPTYIFKASDEENLSNLLLAGKTEQASSLIDEIANANIQNNVPDSSVMQMYSQIIGIIFKVMKIKNIEYDTENKGDYTLISEAVSFSIINTRNYIGNLLDKLSEQSPVNNAKVDINAIIDYIEANYQQELFLDGLAEMFGTTPKYLSKLIKAHLGVTFLAYLSGLRINKAKELLAESDKNINEIYTEVGFNNRNSFTTTFKKIVGLTPSEYKRLSYTKNKEKE